LLSGAQPQHTHRAVLRAHEPAQREAGDDAAPSKAAVGEAQIRLNRRLRKVWRAYAVAKQARAQAAQARRQRKLERPAARAAHGGRAAGFDVAQQDVG